MTNGDLELDAPIQPVSLPPGAAAAGVFSQTVEHSSGIPLGGVGTGSIEIRPNGCLDDWLIFNNGDWATTNTDDQLRADHGPSNPSMDSEAMQFYLRLKTPDGPPILRRLSVDGKEDDVYLQSWAKPVEGIAYDGRYPVARLSYRDASLPVAITGAFFSPIVPHDSRTSGTPGFYAVFTIKNESKRPADVALAAKLRNPIARGNDDDQRSAATRKLANSITQNGPTTFLTMRTAAQLLQKSTLGSLSLSVTGGTASWITADFRQYMRALHDTDFGTMPQSFLEGFRAEGKLPNLGDTECPANLVPPGMDVDKIPEAELDHLLGQAAKVASLKAWIDRSRTLKTGLATAAAKRHVLSEFQDRLDSFAGSDRRAPDWGDAALCSSLTLQPGEEKEICFTFAWYFPHHLTSRDGSEIGHRYAEWFKDAQDVNEFLVANSRTLRAKVNLFADAMTNSSVGHDIAFPWTAQLTTLVKNSWWTRDDKFGIWEGLGSGGLNTTDIMYQGSFPVIALFPDLHMKQMENSAKFQRADGRVAHNFYPDLDTVDHGFDRVDLDPQFVMLVCRDWLWTGDCGYLKRLWPYTVRAMDSMAAMDTDKDGLPDRDTSHNTYDAWELRGTPAYISNLWLGALVSAIRMANAVGDSSHANAWSAWLASASASFEKKVWNGEYYSLWVDGDNRDECCMSDQLSGIWFSHLTGFNSVLPPERIRAVIKAVMRYNFNREQGLVNAAYPPGRLAYEPTFGNGQAAATWSGIEYAAAALAIDFGLVQEGFAIIRAVDDRYRRAGRCWKHYECGDNYYRAMSSWATLLALTGFKVDAPAATLSVLPVVRQEELKAPWATCTAWGTLSVLSDKALTLTSLSGELSLRRLRVNLSGHSFHVKLSGTKVSPAVSRANDVAVLDFDDTVTLREGGSLIIRSRG